LRGKGVYLNLLTILGSANSKDGIIPPFGLERIRVAVREMERDEDIKVIPSGGFGYFNESDVPHYELVVHELKLLGVSEDRILPGILAKHTVDEAVMLKAYLENMGVDRLTVITSKFHRVRCLAIFADIIPEIRVNIIGTDNMMSEAELKPYLEKEVLRLGDLVRQGGVKVS
jgi:uncharacterized SAM-binding protein YcdF (DUF218 family)